MTINLPLTIQRKLDALGAVVLKHEFSFAHPPETHGLLERCDEYLLSGEEFPDELLQAIEDAWGDYDEAGE